MLKRIGMKRMPVEMTLKALMHYHPLRIAQYLERIDAKPRPGKNQIRVHRCPGFHQPAEVDA